MSSVADFSTGGFRYLEAVFQYSAGVAAQRGFEIERATLRRPLPLAAGFDLVEKYLRSINRPSTSFCACELRSPVPFDEQGFSSFNHLYVQTLERWGLYRDGRNPVARTNVCPANDPPGSPSLYAFSYTVPARGHGATFVIAGGGEAPEGRPNYRDHIVRLGDRSSDGMREKVRYVLAEMERRLSALGLSWTDALTTNAYTVYDIGALVLDDLARSGACSNGLTWNICRPPIKGLDFEMDVRRAAREVLL